MNKQEVIEYIGANYWKDFSDFIYGQTVGVNKDGSVNYYKWDVEKFKSRIDFRSANVKRKVM